MVLRKVVKTDENGSTEWSTNLGESSQDQAPYMEYQTRIDHAPIVETDDGGFGHFGYAYTGFYE